MAAGTPERTLQQRMRALHKANEVRTYRADLKKQLKAGTKGVVDILLEPPEKVEGMKLYDLLLASPKLGRVKVNKILQLCRVSPAKTVGGLSQRQRTEIVSRVYRKF